MNDPPQAVLAVNTRFYRALGNSDLKLMSRVWMHSREATCIHPGWERLTGWRAIYESWATIFSHQRRMRVWPSELFVKVDSPLAVVTCIENIDASTALIDSLAQAKAMNIFRLAGENWKMLHHHAAPLEIPGFEEFSFPFSSN